MTVLFTWLPVITAARKKAVAMPSPGGSCFSAARLC